MKMQEYAKAAAMFEKTIVCDPKTVSAYLNAGACYMVMAVQDQDRRALLNRAREVLVRAKELNPDNLTIRFRLAQYFAQADSTEQARSEYDAVLNKAREDPGKYRKEAGEAYSQIGVYYLSKKQFDRAAENFRRAIGSGVENSLLQLNWGIAILQTVDPSAPEGETRKKNEDAVKHFRRAVELDPKNAQAHLWLGEGLIRLRVVGDNESIRRLTNEACSEFIKTLALDPSNQDAKREIARFGCK
jgi:tetratricopeptide (TPR) repeat protein